MFMTLFLLLFFKSVLHVVLKGNFALALTYTITDGKLNKTSRKARRRE